MISLILTVLYLAKDTVHRWFARISSPLARVLVVFFLSLCALLFLSSYVLSAKMVSDRIRNQGGDLVQVMANQRRGESLSIPTRYELREMFGADSLSMQQIGLMKSSENAYVPVMTYDFSCSEVFLPLMASHGRPTLLQEEGGPHTPGPATFYLDKEPVEVYVRNLPKDHLALRFFSRQGAIVVQPDSPQASLAARNNNLRIIARIPLTNGAEDIRSLVDYMETFFRLEGAQAHVVSALKLLEEMELIMGNQGQCRLAFCLGIAVIVGILLTALAGMEYRQNEYIYTLMKSFGIHPILLVAAFLAENLLLVGLSFAAAVECFMRLQPIIITQFLKMGNYRLTLHEIMPELQLIGASLLACVLVSSIPIMFATMRDIGRVLK